MPLILDGRKARDSYKAALAKRAAGLGARLAIIQIGDNRESNVYIAQKKKFGLDIGVAVEHIRFDADITQDKLSAEIARLNTRKDIHGIILQLPIPAQIDKLAALNAIDPNKDVDGLTDENQRLLEQGRPRFIPATAKGVMSLLDFYKISVAGKKAVVLGRSRLVGHPMAELLKIRGAAVTVCHSKTPDVPEKARTADILISAVGKAGLVTKSYIGASSSVVIDVGLNTGPLGKLVGDVAFDEVAPLVAAVSPVPGGVGPMTVLSLFDNLILSAEHSAQP